MVERKGKDPQDDRAEPARREDGAAGQGYGGAVEACLSYPQSGMSEPCLSESGDTAQAQCLEPHPVGRENPKDALREPSAPITWEVEVNLFRQGRVLRELAMAFGGGIAFVAIFLVVLQWLDGRLTWEFLATVGKIALGLALLFSVLAIVAMWIMGGRAYPYVYMLDDEGIRVSVATRQRRRNALMYGLLFVVGLLRGRPGAVGAALLAKSREEEFVRWKDVRRIVVDGKTHSALVKHGHQRTMIWFPRDRFHELTQLLERHLAGSKR